MSDFAVFNNQTGAIVEVGHAPRFEWVRPPADPTLTMVQTDGQLDPATQYFDLNLHDFTNKTTCPTPTITYPSSLHATLDPVPRPCRVFVDNTSYVVTDGSAEIVFGSAGTYSVIIASARYLDWTGSVTV